ncbi:MAG: excinuclease ABC subunit UvrB [Bacteroidales bacterium]|nr:excinuclease ABC subunit UvrB [Bacteroidales bacterium]
MDFKLCSNYEPTGDQPEAIKQLTEGIMRGDKFQTLLGVTGSGKTFTMANVINELKRPALIFSHNKTLAAQLYGEFKQFFSENAVEYFVSYYDYYQPEAYIPVTDTYIEKDLSINDEIEKLRISASSALLSGRRDVIVVSSVSCIYGIGNPDEFKQGAVFLRIGQSIARNTLLHKLVDSLYSRSEVDFKRTNFRVKGDTVDVFPAYSDFALRIIFWGDEIEKLQTFDPVNGYTIDEPDSLAIYPASLFITSKDKMKNAIMAIQEDLVKQCNYFRDNAKEAEAKRLEDRVNFDIEMMLELGYCSGIENYSRYFDGRRTGDRPFCLLDCFPDDYIIFVDESHVTIPQIRGMFGGDRSRKQALVEYGFRLPAAMDNRPLAFAEFENMINQAVFVSATPGDYELENSLGVIVEQVIRPTGLPEPVIEIRPATDEVDDLLKEIDIVINRKERVLVTTLTKVMAEELAAYLKKLDISCAYIHSNVDTLDRVDILRNLRLGNFDVLVGVNLLREGLDLPEVSLVAILDADKEGFLRSEKSLIQVAGRAARNINSKVIMYANKITDSMQRCIDETNRRRDKQLAYNLKNNIIPTQIVKSTEAILGQTAVADAKNKMPKAYFEDEKPNLAADPVVKYMSKKELNSLINSTKKAMESAVKNMDFIEAAKYRDELFALQKLVE